MPKRGVIYLATGEQHFLEAVNSAVSLKTNNPDLHCTLFTDEQRNGGCFDAVRIIQEPLYNVYDKCRNIIHTPYEETLYLDSDTFITDSLAPLFEALKYCDVACSIESKRGFWYKSHTHLPNSISELNAGVICFKRTSEVMDTLKKWYPECLRTQGWLHNYGRTNWMLTNDQPAFRELIWSNKNIRVAILPDEYNALRLFGTRLWFNAIIVHGRGNIAKVAREMNRNAGQNRVYLQGAGTVMAYQDVSFLKGIQQLAQAAIAMLYFLFRRK